MLTSFQLSLIARIIRDFVQDVLFIDYVDQMLPSQVIYIVEVQCIIVNYLKLIKSHFL